MITINYIRVSKMQTVIKNKDINNKDLKQSWKPDDVISCH